MNPSREDGYVQAEVAPFEPESQAINMRLALLSKTIEHEIIPRLMMAHKTSHKSICPTSEKDQILAVMDVESFAKLVLSTDSNAAQASVDAMRSRGILIETIYIDLLAPVARYLGELWNQDLCDFTEVTIGLGRLHRILRELSPAFSDTCATEGKGLRVLLLPGPGEQHTFGLLMVSEFFRRAGWDVAEGSWEVRTDPVAMVRKDWFDVIGFSLGSDAHIEKLRQCVDEVRKSSVNTKLAVMVGGPIFSLRPELIARVGSDGAAKDGQQAPDLAEQIVRLRQH
jgi:methanogenic corrinoid protein MtbC1